MPAVKRKTKRFVIDVNCYISIFINQQTDWLLHYIVQNKIEIFRDDNLINELTRVLQYPRIKRRIIFNSSFYLNFVKLVSTNINSQNFNIQSPDSEDNYLYDIALTAHAKLLVTGETALLEWFDTPVETISLAEFRNLFK